MIAKTSPDWSGLKEWLGEQIEKKRVSLEKPGRGIDATNVDRGWIEAYRHLIATVEPKEVKGGGGTNYNR